MRQVHIVRPYADGPMEAFREYSTAYLRKCELDAEYGGTAVLDSLPFQEDKLNPHSFPSYGPSGVSFHLHKKRRRNA